MLIRLSLRERMVLLMVAAILPLAALSVWSALREVDYATGLAKSQLRFAASLVAAQQDRAVESAQHLLGAISAIPDIGNPERGPCESYFAGLRGRYPVYANIGIINLEGRVLCHADGRAGEFRVADRPYFRQALAERTFVVGQAVMGRASGQYVVPFAQPVFDRGGQPVAVAFAALDLEQAAAALARLEMPEGSRVLIADRRGAVLMEHPPQPGLVRGRLLANAEVLAAAQGTAVAAGAGEGVDARGNERIFGYAPTRLQGGERYLATVTIARDQVTSAFMRTLRGELALLALFLLAGLGSAWWIGGRTIVKPARQILGAVRRLELGSLDARVPVDGSAARSEFARIGLAFNRMAESLQLRARALQDELDRSRAAYDALDQVLNSMQEGLIAADAQGRFLMYNDAAARMFDFESAPPDPAGWAAHFGLYRPDGSALPAEDLPMVRAMRGESDMHMPVLVRNARTPEGRMLQCSFRPLRGSAGGGLLVFSDTTLLQRAESDLELLRNAVARLNDIVLITEAAPLDAPGPRIVFVNEAFERLTGFTAAEAMGASPRMLHGPGTDPTALARIRKALDEGLPVREELVNYTKDGRPLWLDVDIVPLGEGRGRYTHLIGVMRDVTARKHAEHELRDRERELREFTGKLQRTAEAAQAIAAHHTPGDTMQEVVDQARQVIGAHQAVLSLPGDGEHAITALSLSDKYREWQGLRASPDGGGIYSVVAATGRALRLTQPELEAHPRWRAFGGRPHPPLRGLLVVPLTGRAGANGRVVGLLMLSDKYEGEFTEHDEYVAMELAQMAAVSLESARLFVEIRELNAGLEARIDERTAELVQKEQQFRTLAEQAPEVVWMTDLEGRVTFANRAWVELVGGRVEDALGLGYRKRMHPDDLPETDRKWQQARRTGEPFSGTRRVLSRTGHWHTMAFRAGPVLDARGATTHWIGIDTDITEVKAIEGALRSSNQELEAFSYSVSHDLRAPLGAIGGFSRALSNRLGENADERARHYLARIQAGVEKMEQLIEALLSLAKVVRAPLNYGPVDLGAMARDTLEGLQMEHPERRVQAKVEDGLTAQGDARLLRLVLQNLLGNAWKFTSTREAALIEVGRQGASGVFYVRDNGVGFDMAYADKLFSAFHRLHTEAEFPGTGIGLATVRRIVARHQGRVWADSRPGEGTTFFFTLGDSAPPAWLAERG